MVVILLGKYSPILIIERDDQSAKNEMSLNAIQLPYSSNKHIITRMRGL